MQLISCQNNALASKCKLATQLLFIVYPVVSEEVDARKNKISDVSIFDTVLSGQHRNVPQSF